MSPLEQLAGDLTAPLSDKEQAARHRQHVLAFLRTVQVVQPDVIALLRAQLGELLRPSPASIASHERPAAGEVREP